MWFKKKQRMSKDMKDRMMEIWEESVKKQIEFEKLSQSELNYEIIQDLINSAAHGVCIEVTLTDGSKLVMKRETPYDTLQDQKLF